MLGRVLRVSCLRFVAVEVDFDERAEERFLELLFWVEIFLRDFVGAVTTATTLTVSTPQTYTTAKSAVLEH